MRRSPSSRIWPLLGSGVLLLLLGVSPWGLWERDEGRYADAAREMLARGDFITPRIDGAVFLDKPPLVYWVTAASLSLWGHGETGARFGQILFAAGILLVTRRIGFLLFERRRANVALTVLASSVGFFAACHLLTLDLGLAFFVSLSLLLFLKGYRAGAEGSRWYLGMCAAVAGGVLTKGPIGAVLPAITIACFLTLRREWRRAREIPWVGGALLFFAIVTPWYVAVSIANPEFAGYFFVHEHLERFGTTVHRHPGAWYYYLAVFAAGLMPWSLLLPLQLPRIRWRPPGLFAALQQEAPAFLWSWVLPGLLFFSVAQSKLPLYVLPLFPAAALLIATLIDREIQDGSYGTLFLWPSMLLVVAGAGAAVLWHRHNEWEFLQRAGIAFPLGVLVATLAAGALLSGAFLARRGRHLAGLAMAAVLWMAGCYAVLGVVGRVNFFNETKHFATILRQEMRRGEPVYAYQCYLRGLPFYLRETVGLVSPHSDDLKLGRLYGHDPGTFPDEASFLRVLGGDGRVFVVVRQEDLQPLQKRVGRPLYILARSSTYELLSNRLGADRERALRALLDATRFDLETALARAVRVVPGASIDLIEIERLRGEPTCTVRASQGASRLEISIPMARPAQLTVSGDDPAGEESGEEDHLLRLSPLPGSVTDIPGQVLKAAGK
jgi:4-amino-4-deoxy-L-arabinose transferase-like glycosyltransferase